jgi:type I restriction enzyme S subunit
MSQTNGLTGWKITKLGEVCSLRAESVHPSQSAKSRYVGLEHIDSGKSNLARWGNATEVNSSKSKFYAGDILYGKLRPYLDKAVLAEFEGICSTDILVLKSDQLIAPEFLSNLVHTNRFIEHAMKTTRGVNHPRTSWASLAEFEFSRPPLPEQRVIARALRAVQEAREARQKELQLERERKATLTHHLFTYGTRGEALKQTEIGEIPGSWKIERLEECLTIGLRNGIYKPAEFYGRGNVKIVEITGLYDCDRVLELDSTLKTIVVTGDELGRYSLKNGDVLINRVSKRHEGIGQARLVKSDENQSDSVVYESNMFRARFNGEKVNPEFFSFFASSELYLTQVMRKAQKGNQTSINQPSINSILIACPDISDQQEIVGYLRVCEMKIDALQKEALLLDELFRVMLEELMTGKVSAVPLTENE